MPKQILILGAGKSATCLINYLLDECAANNWRITVDDNGFKPTSLCRKPIKTGSLWYTT